MRYDKLSSIADMYYLISKRWAVDWNAINKNKLTVTQAIALNILVAEGKKKASELANLLSITTGGLTGVIEKLVERKWVDRVRDEDDRRVVYLAITESGRVIFDELQQDRIKMMEDLFGVLNDEEIQSLIAIHSKLLRK